MAYPGENVRVIGAIKIKPSWFKPVSDKSPVWNRIDSSAKGKLMQVDLKSHGITDYGTLQMRGWGAKGPVVGAMELFYDGEPMTLARWPNKDFTDDNYLSSDYDNEIQIYGTTKPDITGLYIKSGSQDGVPSYKRDGLVNGKQYYAYRYTWDYEGNTYTAWFITTGTTGYPTKDDPWWSLYSHNLGQFKL